MGLFQKLKSVLGLDGTTSSGTGPSGDVDVTVEREPSTEDEDAVKGTDTATADSAVESDTATTDSEPVVPDESEPEVTEDNEADAEAELDESDEPEPESEATDDESEDAEPAADHHDEGPPEAVAEDEPDDEGSDDPVTEIKGIGPAYADRLHGQGIETVGQLADADPAAIAAETDLGEGRVSDWVERASEY